MPDFVLDGLSSRAQKFVIEKCLRVPLGSSAPLLSAPDSFGPDILDFQNSYGGVILPVLGGELRGWVRLGVRTGKVSVTPEGERIYNCAQPQFAQCGLYCREDGWFGVSWSGEFLPWHSSISQLIESAAVWSSLHGWTVWSLTGEDPERIAAEVEGVDLDSVASCSVTRWWIGENIAVYSEPYLTYSGTRVRISVRNRSDLTGIANRVSLEKKPLRMNISSIESLSPPPPEFISV